MLYAFKTYQDTQDVLSKIFCENSGKDWRWLFPDEKRKIPSRMVHKWSCLSQITKDDEVVYSGFLRDTKLIYYKALDLGINHYYLDHPYFLHPNYIPKHKETNNIIKENATLYGKRYFRATKNRFNCTTIVDKNSKKYDEIYYDEKEHIELKLQDWTKSGSHILVLPPSPTLYDTLGIDKDKLLTETIEEVKKYTNREIKIRYKKTGEMGRNPTDIREDLKDCWAVISFGTAGAVKAIMSGIPVFCNEYSPTLPVSMPLSMLSKIENPLYPDREDWLYNLINNQFSYTEVQDKKINIYKYLNEKY